MPLELQQWRKLVGKPKAASTARGAGGRIGLARASKPKGSSGAAAKAAAAGGGEGVAGVWLNGVKRGMG